MGNVMLKLLLHILLDSECLCQNHVIFLVILNSVTLGDSLRQLNILKDIWTFKYEYPKIFLDIWNFRIFNSVTLGDAPDTCINLNILKDIQIFKFEYPQIFLDIQLCDIGRCPRTLEYP